MRNTTFHDISVFLRRGSTAAAAGATDVGGPGAEFAYAGTVLDGCRRPIAGARVALIGTSCVTATGAMGRFGLEGVLPAEGSPSAEAPALPPLCLLEFSADGCQARTILPASPRAAGMTVLLDRLPLGVEGEPADIAPYAYAYRRGADDNPWETRWLEPTDDMLCGLLWEEKPLIDRVEAEFGAVPGTLPDPRDITLGILSGGLYPRRVHPTETINWYARDKRALTRYLASPEVVKTTRGTVVFTFRHDPIGRPGNLLFPAASLPRRNHPVQAMSLHCRGADLAVAIPTLRVYGPVLWARPRTLDIEWGLSNGLPRHPVNGWIEAHYGNIIKVEALEPAGGVAMAGAHHWREGSAAPGRRGIRVTVMPMAGPPYHRTAVNFYATDVLGGAYDEITTVQPTATLTFWTSIGSASIALGDLDRGPIHIPSLGLLVAPADNGLTGREFLARRAAAGAKTVRQRVREHPEQTYAGAMAAVFGEAARNLPPFPEPPYEPPMRIEVPEEALVRQWRLGAWHLKRWSRRMADNVYAISIWRFRDDKPTCIAAETQQIIKTFDLLGLHDMAEGGLNYWFAAKEYAAGGNEGGGYGNYFSDFDGFLLTDQYDMRHVNGHGEILHAVAQHYRITGDATWARGNATRLRKACEWIVRQRRQWNEGASRASWAYGLFPPSGIGDGYGLDTWFCANAEYGLGLKLTADILAEIGMEGAQELQAEAERYRQDIRAAAERSIALSPVLPVGDGTYRRYMPPGLYMRKSMLGWHKEVTSGAMWLVGEDRIFGANEPIAQELLDVIEEVLQAGDTQTADWLSKGGTGSQTGWERHKALYLLCDDIPPFLRALYNGYAGDIQPWEAIAGQPSCRFQDGRLAAGSLAGRPAAYTFWEHPQGGAPDKTHGEAVFLEYVRNLLVMEIGDALWLARATPRVWLEQGKKISVKNAPTHFGTLAYEIVSDADSGKISATIEMPSRQAPKEVALRFRHPKATPIKAVTVNGKPWTEFNVDKETITLKRLTGTVAVTAQY